MGAPPCVLSLLLIAQLTGLLAPVNGLCTCAERFAKVDDFTNDSSTPFFDNRENGETIVFRSAAFHCNTTLSTVQYSGLTIKGCSENCQGNSVSSNTEPILQLWRQINETVFDFVEMKTLTKGSTSMDLEWSVTPNDVIGLWIPPSCDCMANYFKIGYLYGPGGSRVYRINGDYTEEPFDSDDYKLEYGPLPMITVETTDEFNVVCIIGLPAGALVTIIALCFTCGGICWSITLQNKKQKKTGQFEISHPIQDNEQQETELNEMSLGSNSYNAQNTEVVSIDSNTLSRPIYHMPLPPIPTNIDDADFPETRSLTSSSPHPNHQHVVSLPHSMSNPDLSASHGYGNIDHSGRHFHSLARDAQPIPHEPQPAPRQPVPQPRISRALSNPSTMEPPNMATNNLPPPPPPPPAAITVPMIEVHAPLPPPPITAPPPSREPQLDPVQDKEDEAEQSYDRHSEYEIPDDESSEGGIIQDEYMTIGTTLDNIESSGSNDVYY